MAEVPSRGWGAKHDMWTVAAIAIVAYCVANLLHEGVGHGGACLLAGCEPKMLNAIFFDFDEKAVADSAMRAIAAGGSIVNFVAACIALAVLRSGWPRSNSGRYFMWLLAAVNLLDAFGYLLFSGVGGIGDWKRVVEGWEPAVLYRVLLAVAGGILYFVVAPKMLMPAFAHFMNKEGDAARQARRLMLFPYLVGGTTYVVAGLFNPYGLELVLISAAAASFGGTSLLAWYPVDKKVAPLGDAGGAPFVVGRSLPWLVAGTVTLAIFLGVLGPGLEL